jgi:hypothetical protein
LFKINELNKKKKREREKEGEIGERINEQRKSEKIKKYTS